MTSKNFQPGNFLRTCQAENFEKINHAKKYRIFGNKCWSRHQIPTEKIHLIESEVTQNIKKKNNILKCKKCQKTDRSKYYSNNFNICINKQKKNCYSCDIHGEKVYYFMVESKILPIYVRCRVGTYQIWLKCRP